MSFFVKYKYKLIIPSYHISNMLWMQYCNRHKDVLIFDNNKSSNSTFHWPGTERKVGILSPRRLSKIPLVFFVPVDIVLVLFTGTMIIPMTLVREADVAVMTVKLIDHHFAGGDDFIHRFGLVRIRQGLRLAVWIPNGTDRANIHHRFSFRNFACVGLLNLLQFVHNGFQASY